MSNSNETAWISHHLSRRSQENVAVRTGMWGEFQDSKIASKIQDRDKRVELFIGLVGARWLHI